MLDIGTRFTDVMSAIDAVNAEDPNLVRIDGRSMRGERDRRWGAVSIAGAVALQAGLGVITLLYHAPLVLRSRIRSLQLSCSPSR
jgi:hypothetical protein